MDEDDVWFEPKSRGFGSGVPVRWQGWALIIGYITLIVVLSLLLNQRHAIVCFILIGMTTVALAVVAARHTRGGWRWRW